MNMQLNNICSRKRPSILRANTKDEIANFDFEKACLEWKERAPIFYAFLCRCTKGETFGMATKCSSFRIDPHKAAQFPYECLGYNSWNSYPVKIFGGESSV